MNLRRSLLALPLVVATLAGVACSSVGSDNPVVDPQNPDGSSTTSPTGTGTSTTAPTNTTPQNPAGPNVIGVPGIEEWKALADKDAIKTFGTLYLHQSVGQDLEDGSEASGYSFEYYGPDNQAGKAVKTGLNGGIFTDVANVPNGQPMQKMAAVRAALGRHKANLKVLFFSFGYADVRDEDLGAVEAEYQKLVGEIKAAGLKFVHVTPPLVYSTAENPPKMKMRAWMLDTFKSDIIFDLQDIESLDEGKRCEEGGVWRICQANRSTPSCPSKGQGIDGDGAGHLCERKATDFAKALLLAIHRAGK